MSGDTPEHVGALEPHVGACDGPGLDPQASGVQDINSYMVLDKDCRGITVTTRPAGSPQRCLQVQWPVTKVNRTGDVQILGCGDHPCLAVAGVGSGREVVARASSMAPQLTVSTLAAVGGPGCQRALCCCRLTLQAQQSRTSQGWESLWGRAHA